MKYQDGRELKTPIPDLSEAERESLDWRAKTASLLVTFFVVLCPNSCQTSNQNRSVSDRELSLKAYSVILKILLFFLLSYL